MNLWTRRLNLGLSVTAIVIFGFGAATVVSIPFRLNGLTAQKRIPEIPKYASFKLKSLQAYVQPFKSHALFYIQEAPVRDVAQKARADNFFQKYHLIGIVQGIQPAAVIQNTSKKTTHLVQPGEAFDQIKVVQVLSKSVLLDDHGNRKLLPLQDATP